MKQSIQNLFCFCALLTVTALFLSACEDPYRHRIIGNWISSDISDVHLTFANDGTFSYRNKQKPLGNVTGTYSFVGDEQVKIDPKGGLVGILGNIVGLSGFYEVTISNDRSILIDEDGSKDSYFKDTLTRK